MSKIIEMSDGVRQTNLQSTKDSVTDHGTTIYEEMRLSLAESKVRHEKLVAKEMPRLVKKYGEFNEYDVEKFLRAERDIAICENQIPFWRKFHSSIATKLFRITK